MGNRLFWPSLQPLCKTGQGTGPALCCALSESRITPACISPSTPHPSREAQAGVGHPACVELRVWRERWGGAQGWVAESVVSGKAGMFSSTARLPRLPPLSLSPACCMGPLQAPWEHHNLPFCSLPSPKDFSHPFWFIFCSDVCSLLTHPHTHKKNKTKTEKIGVNGGAELPSWASSLV